MSNTDVKKSILRLAEYKCVYCGDYADTVDHKIPSMISGRNTPRINLVACCNNCNQAKSHFYSYEVFLRMTRIYGKLSIAYMKSTNKRRLHCIECMWKHREHMNCIRFYNKVKIKFPDNHKQLLKRFIFSKRYQANKPLDTTSFI